VSDSTYKLRKRLREAQQERDDLKQKLWSYERAFGDIVDMADTKLCENATHIHVVHVLRALRVVKK
jgi:hypothetical protein